MNDYQVLFHWGLSMRDGSGSQCDQPKFFVKILKIFSNKGP